MPRNSRAEARSQIVAIVGEKISQAQGLKESLEYDCISIGVPLTGV